MHGVRRSATVRTAFERPTSEDLIGIFRMSHTEYGISGLASALDQGSLYAMAVTYARSAL